jgi:hypothetical protein
MVFSAQDKDLYIPSQSLLQAQCYPLYASARNQALNNFGHCSLGGVSDIEVQNAHLIRYARCSERCLGQTGCEGGCGCTIDARLRRIR